MLDFADVEYISSAGLRVLMIAAKQMRARDAKIAVAALQPMVAEIFAISRLIVSSRCFRRFGAHSNSCRPRRSKRSPPPESPQKT